MHRSTIEIERSSSLHTSSHNQSGYLVEVRLVLKTLPTADDRIVGFAIDGTITADDIDRITAEITQRLESHDRLRLYAEVNTWTGISPQALLKDLRFSLQHFKDFEKEAIVSDKSWLKVMAETGDRLLPHTEVKHFSWEHQADALEWVEG